MAEESTAAGATDAKGAESTEAATLLTEGGKPAEKPAEEAKPKEGDTAEKKADDTQTDKKDEKPPEVPEKYDLKLPEGTLINDELMNEFTAIGKEQKWDNATAQKMADLHLKSISTFAEQQAAAFQEKVTSWANDFKADKELVGNVEIDGKQVTKVDATLEDARKVLHTFGTPEEVQALQAELNNSGLGNFKTLIKGLAKFAQFVGEDKMTIGRPGASQPADVAHRLYPNNP